MIIVLIEIFFSDNDPSIVASSEFTNNASSDTYTVHCTGGEIDVAICAINVTNPACSSGDFVGIRCRMYQYLALTLIIS